MKTSFMNLRFSVQQLGPSDVTTLRAMLALYTKLGTREDVAHFDIAVAARLSKPG
jgi:hypothetical protein